MQRLALTWLGVLALLLAAPPEAGAAELVRTGIAPSSVAPQVEVPTHGAAPRERTWTEVLAGTHVPTGAPSASPEAPPSTLGDAQPADVGYGLGPKASSRVLPDARAPPA